MRTRRPWGQPARLVVACALTILIVGHASALTIPQLRCQSSKLQITGKYVACRHAAEANLVAKGNQQRYEAAISKCRTQLAKAWQKAEAKAAKANETCLDTQTSETALRSLLDAQTAEVASALAGSTLSDCSTGLATCQENLGTCSADRSECEDALSSCENLGICSSCETSLASCQDDLGGCIAQRNTCNASLSTCSSDLATWQSYYSTCTNELESAQACGNGYTESWLGEECDQSDLAGKTCVTEGYEAGTLACGPNCRVQTHGCLSIRYVPQEDGTVIDLETWLQWEQKVNLDFLTSAADPHDADNTYTWSISRDAADGAAFTSFLATLNASAFAGYNDWRLPSVLELASLVDLSVTGCGAFSPCIDPIVGPTRMGCYWTSNTGVSPSEAYIVCFHNGWQNPASKKGAAYVRAVRSTTPTTPTTLTTPTASPYPTASPTPGGECVGGSGYPLCTGSCPPGQGCVVTAQGCYCLATSHPCNGDDFPACDGTCPPGETCHGPSDGVNYNCLCLP